MPVEQRSVSKSALWLVLTLVALAACIVLTQVEETTLMRGLWWMGAAFALICAAVNVAEIFAAVKSNSVSASSGDVSIESGNLKDEGKHSPK